MLPDLSLYERLIDYGIADADARGDSIDHVTARRLAIWLAARPQPPPFARGLVRFVKTGEITPALKTQLRIHARSGTHPDRPQAVRLIAILHQPGAALGPVSQDFGAACDQIDRADLMLADLRERARQHLAQPDRPGPRPTAPDHRPGRPRPQSQTVSLILDATTANAALFAIAAHADEREAHVREVEQFGQSLPEGSYGRRNRQAIAARETRSPPGSAPSSAPTAWPSSATPPNPPEPGGLRSPRAYGRTWRSSHDPPVGPASRPPAPGSREPGPRTCD